MCGGGGWSCRVSSSKVKLQSSNLIKSIREFLLRVIIPAALMLSITSCCPTVHDECHAGTLVPGLKVVFLNRKSLYMRATKVKTLM